MKYETFILRNSGYITELEQERIKNTKILIAGCGVGSSIAEAALRMGFINITLVDGDTVSESNLNRQFYSYSDVGKPKVEALKQRLLNICPFANIKAINAFLTKDTVSDVVSECDMIFDTVDFLDLSAITYLHDAAHAQKKPLISAVSAGWGAVVMFFSGQSSQDYCQFRDLLNLPSQGDVAHCSYIEHFKPFLSSVAPLLDESILNAMAKALTMMEDNIPCPAPHLSVGSFSVAALSLTCAINYMRGEMPVEYTKPIVVSLNQIARQN